MSDGESAETIVGGRYRLDERLDSGGLSTVWRATDLDRSVPVAVKCESDGTHDAEQVRRHFRKELRWVRRFADGPTPGSLVHFVDGSVDDGRSYVVMELITGGSIADRFDADARPGLDAVRSLAGPVCRAVAFLHCNGVVHLDLKPTNVLVRRRGPPAVIDLNSAVSSDAGTGTLFHFDPFKPPELTPTDARDVAAGPWSDVYALGKLLVFLLTGDAPSCDASERAAWEPVDLRSVGVDCPPELATAIRRATAPQPEDRFDDALALVDSLGSVLDVSDEVAMLEHEASGIRIPLRAGDVLGRFSPDGPVPDIVIPDADRYLSPAHATIDRDGTTWVLTDRSLNGTFVERGGSRRFVISPAGLERRQASDAPLPERTPPASVSLGDGTTIAPVTPEYGCHLTFRTE